MLYFYQISSNCVSPKDNKRNNIDQLIQHLKANPEDRETVAEYIAGIAAASVSIIGGEKLYKALTKPNLNINRNKGGVCAGIKIIDPLNSPIEFNFGL